MSKILSTTPIFRSFDETKTREFYLDYLGFSVVFEHRFEPTMPLYMGIIRDGFRMHLSEHHGDCCPGGAVRVEIDDIVAFHNELKEKNYANLNPGIQKQPWGSREVNLTDPFGNRLVFFESDEE